jgi:hypothetical protein
VNLEELEAKVRILDDIEQIKQLQIRYVNYLTTCQWDELVDCFDENGATDFPYPDIGVTRGKAAIEKDFKERIAKGHIGQEGNFVVHPLITVDGDKAKGSWLLYIQSPYGRKRSTGENSPDWVQGYYEMEYIKKNGNWKISLLKWSPRLVSSRPQ